MIRHVMFDFDGTLADTSEGIINSMHYAYDKMGIRRVEDHKIADLIGPPLEEMLRSLWDTEDPELIRKGVVYFRERYSTQGRRELTLYPEVAKTLRELQRSGKKLYIVTSKPEIFVRQICEEYDILECFTDITGVSVNETSLSKGKRMQQLMERYAIKANSSIMVGDRPEDALAAAENQVSCIGMTYGFSRKEELIRAGCIHLGDSIPHLIELLQRIEQENE